MRDRRDRGSAWRPGGPDRLRRKIKSTIDEDAWLLRNMADYDIGLEGMTLSRFDRVLGLTRERLARIYVEAG